jgi:hypothetical protein
VRAVKHRLDVGRLVREHPWAALTVAAGTGALVAASGADARAAGLAIERARDGGAAGVRLAREGSAAGIRLAREAPSRSRGAIGAAVDALGVKLVTSLMNALRESAATRPTPESHGGLGFVKNDAPAHESEQEPRP